MSTRVTSETASPGRKPEDVEPKNLPEAYRAELLQLRERVAEAEETLQAIRHGEVDALVVTTPEGEEKIYTLQGAETPYRVMVEEMQEGAINIGPDGIVLYCNRRFAEMLEVPLDQVLGSSLLERASEEDRPLLAQLLVEGARGLVRAETSLRRGGGSLVPVLLSINPLSGVANRECIVVTDLTLQKNHEAVLAAQDALRRSEEQARRMAEAMPQLVWTWAAEGNLVYANQRWYRFTGLTPEQTTGLGWLQSVHPEDRARVQAAAEASMKSGDDFEQEFRLRGREGSYTWHLARAVAVAAGDGWIERWIGTATDVDAQRRAEEHLRQTQKLESVGLLAGGVAHDFNNLLTGIVGNTRLTLETEPLSDSAREMLNAAVRAADRAADLTRQLLTYSGRSRMVRRRADLSELVREIASLVYSSLPKKATLKLDLGSRLPPVEVDGSQMQQLVMNLILNGAEAGGEKGCHVTVKTRLEQLGAAALHEYTSAEELQPGAYMCLCVEDTGSGMDPETLSRMFDPFFTTKFTGRGLGLAAVQGIVRGHKGAFLVRSTPGRGTTFKVLLPPAQQGGTTVEPGSPGAQELKGNSTILVVDDEPTVRQLARISLERFGYHVLLAENGQEALQVLEENKGGVSLILLDMIMPVMSGEEALPHLRRIQPDVHVLIFSGYSEYAMDDRLQALGAVGFVQKPFAPVELARRIHQILSKDGVESPGRPG